MMTPEEERASREKRLANMREYHKRTYQARKDDKNAKRRDQRRMQDWYRKHAERIKAERKQWYQENREEVRKKEREKLVLFRKMVLEHYGGKCACCGETEYKFLAMDHINSDGAAHRRIIGKGGSTLYRWLVKNDFPSGFQVLCHNCNAAKGLYGECPHQQRSNQ